MRNEGIRRQIFALSSILSALGCSGRSWNSKKLNQPMLIEDQSQHGLHEGLAERNRNKLFSGNTHPKNIYQPGGVWKVQLSQNRNKMPTPIHPSPSICPHSLQHNGYIQYFLACEKILLMQSIASDRSIHDVLWKVKEICPLERLKIAVLQLCHIYSPGLFPFQNSLWAEIVFLLVAGAGKNLRSMGKFIAEVWYQKIGTEN